MPGSMRWSPGRLLGHATSGYDSMRRLRGSMCSRRRWHGCWPAGICGGVRTSTSGGYLPSKRRQSLESTFVGPLPSPTLHGTYVEFRITASLPTTGLAKDLPPLPVGHTETWTLYVTKRQWDRVAQAFRANQEERAIAEGIAVIREGACFLWVTALKSLSIEKARQEAQKAQAPAVG